MQFQQQLANKVQQLAQPLLHLVMLVLLEHPELTVLMQ